MPTDHFFCGSLLKFIAQATLGFAYREPALAPRKLLQDIQADLPVEVDVRMEHLAEGLRGLAKLKQEQAAASWSQEESRTASQAIGRPRHLLAIL